MLNDIKTERDFQKRIQDLIQNIKKETVLFPDDSAQKKRRRIDDAEKDLYYFAKTYFPHYIRAPFGDPHRAMHMNTTPGCIVAVAGFRGLGKTVFLSIIKPIWLALYEKIHFNVKVAENETLARERTEAIRCEFMFNQRLINDFGEQFVGAITGEETDFVTKNNVRFLALGYKQGIRGKLHGSYRPDYIDIDDIEDHKSFNERIADDKFKFVTEECYGALEDGKGYIVWLGNLTHQKSALNKFKKDCESNSVPERKMLIIPIETKDKDGNIIPTWKEKHTMEDLYRIQRAMGKFGYERHMMMNPVIEGLKFKEAWFKYYRATPICESIVTYCDPSLGEKTSSDYKAIITLGFLQGRYYLLDARIRQASILDMLRYMYYCDQTFQTRLYMESNFWQKILWDYIPDLSKEFNYIMPVAGIENKEKKELRIERLQPLFEWGWILFPETESEDLALLKDQLLGFPDYPHDDGPDALEGATRMLKINSEPNSYKSAGKRLATRFSQVW